MRKAIILIGLALFTMQCEPTETECRDQKCREQCERLANSVLDLARIVEKQSQDITAQQVLIKSLVEQDAKTIANQAAIVDLLQYK